MRKDDAIRLRHMIEAASEAVSYAEGRTRSDLNADRMRARAIVRCIEIVGEAAAQLSLDARDEISDLPWPAVISMRNRLVHAYFDVDLDRVWETLQTDLPQLIKILQPYLPQTDNNS